MAKIIQIFLIIGSIGAFIFLSASCGGNAWTKGDLGFIGDYTSGLWRYCYLSVCKWYQNDDLKDWFKACRGLAVISVLAAIAGIVLSILSLIVDKIKGVFATLFLFGAAGFMLFALVIYASKDSFKGSLDPGWSYILGWIGIVVAGTAGVLGIISDK